MKTLLISLCVVAVLVVIVAILFRLLRGTSNLEMPEKEVEELSMKDIVDFFKDKPVIEQLRADSDLIAVVLKEGGDKSLSFMLCIFSKKDNTIKTPLLRYKASKIDAELQKAFGDKQMIVLK